MQIPLKPTVINSSSCPRSFLKFTHLNVRSCKNKTVQIHYVITDNEFDVLVITQTWLSDQGDETHITEMTPNGYQFHSFPRCSRRGVGITLVSKCSPKSVSVKRLNYQCLEAVPAKLLHSSKSMSDPLPAKLISSRTKCFLMSYLVSLLTWQAGQQSW